MSHDRRISQAGFTLIEATLVILIMGVMAAALSAFIVGPVTGYLLATERSVAIEDGAFVLERISREVRTAIPNTVRVKPSPGVNASVEFVPAIGAVVYRRTGGNDLTFDQPTSSFDVIGNYPDGLAAAVTAGDTLRLVVYQEDAYTTGGTSDQPLPGINLYNSNPGVGPFPAANSHVVTPSTTTVSLNTSTTFKTAINASLTQVIGVTLSSPFQFAFDSPQQKMYIFDSNQAPVSYVCDTNFGTLTRFAGYAVTASQPNIASSAPLVSASSTALVADNISSCSFAYSPGVSYRSAVLTITIGIRSQGGEDMQLIQQVQIPSSP